jgi:glycosyltransferase involved in cell wall biosynthesis
VIALVHGARAYGAVESYAEALVRGLAAGEHGATLLCPDDPAVDALAAAAEGSVDVERYPAALLDAPGPRIVAELRRRLRRLRPSTVHVLDVWPVAQVAARLAGARRLILTHHTPELPRADSAAGRLWWALGWAARPLVVYTSDADRRSDGRRFQRAAVVPLGIDVSRYERGVPALRSDGPIVGNVARLAAQKGHETLLEAVPLVRARRPDARFVVVGEGELRSQLEERARSLGVADSVEFLGARTDVPDLLASFTVFAFPSRFEGLCLAVIEAQVAGVPVVATPVGGIVETVVDGVTGLLCEPQDPRSLADGILRLLADGDLRARLADEARARATTRFSQERMVAGTLALYRGRR